MGQKHGKAAHGFNSKRTKQLVKETNFSDAEVHALAIHFEGISSKVGGEHVIDRNQFKSALGFKDSLFLNRMFMLFDTDGDSQINFEEFVSGISCARVVNSLRKSTSWNAGGLRPPLFGQYLSKSS